MCFENRDAAYAEVCRERDTLKKKLAAYENTGVTPEEIVHIKTGIERVWKLMQDIDEEKLKHIEELVDAENEGRLVVLPCKVGDTVWILDHKFAAEIEKISIGGEDGPCFEWTEYDRGFELTEVWDEGYFTEKDIGKTVFLTREEAEAAIAADKNDGCKKVNDLYDEEGGEILNE